MGLNGVLAPSYNGVAEPPKSLQHQEIALLKGLKLHKEDVTWRVETRSVERKRRKSNSLTCGKGNSTLPTH